MCKHKSLVFKNVLQIQGMNSLQNVEYLQEEFQKMAEDVKKVKTRPADQELLDLYGLYKQAMVGEIDIGMMCSISTESCMQCPLNTEHVLSVCHHNCRKTRNDKFERKSQVGCLELQKW